MPDTVGNLLDIPSPRPTFLDGEFSTSTKQWVADFPTFDLRYTMFHEPTKRAIDGFLGHLSGLEGPSTIDYLGLETDAFRLNTTPQMVSSEGDVTRDFDQNIAPIVAKAFCGRRAVSLHGSTPLYGSPKLWPRSLVGSKGESQTLSTKFVDYQMMMAHSNRSLEQASMVGEMKKPLVIRRPEWTANGGRSAVTKRLQRELGAYVLILTHGSSLLQPTNLQRYAYEYRCPQVFLFDSNTLVIAQFKARSLDEIQSENCSIDCCVIPREFHGAARDLATMQYALYRLAWRGWIRLCATLEVRQNSAGDIIRTKVPLKLDGYTRIYEYYSGRPIWMDEYGRSYGHQHPNGYYRDFVYSNNAGKTEGFWRWTSGHFDTLDCFT